MSVSILTITHGNIGYELLLTAKSMLRELPLNFRSISVSDKCKPENVLNKAMQLCSTLDEGDGILILTDIFGSTPSNICNKLKCNINTHVITGINLPMLIRVMNYPELCLKDLVNKALSGAHDGIVDCESKA